MILLFLVCGLWAESEGINKLRSLTIEEDFPQCAACENKDYCSICLIRNANESSQGDYKNINPYFCEIARIKKNLAENRAETVEVVERIEQG